MKKINTKHLTKSKFLWIILTEFVTIIKNNKKSTRSTNKFHLQKKFLKFSSISITVLQLIYLYQNLQKMCNE